MKSKICLIRHGITRGNRDRLYYGQSDIPLIEDGEKEISRLAKEGIYPDSEDAVYYTTGLQRTEQTFGLIYGDKPHDRIELLQEINFGEYEMKTHEELKGSGEYQRWRHEPQHVFGTYFKGIRGAAQSACIERTFRAPFRKGSHVCRGMPRRQHIGDPVPSVSEAVPGQPLLLDPGSGARVCAAAGG